MTADVEETNVALRGDVLGFATITIKFLRSLRSNGCVVPRVLVVTIHHESV